MWDVGVERTVEVSGPDADKLIDMITCRDLTKCAVKQGKYMIVTAPDGGIVNDPVLLHVDENTWWMQLADSDAGLYALGVAASSGLNAKVSLPDVHPMQVQGPMSAKTLEKLVGSAIYDIKYYWCERFDIDGIPVLISRTGWTAIPGFEVNLLDYSQGRRAVGRRRRRRRGVRDQADRAVRGPADRGRDLQLRLGHDARRHADARDGARAPHRGSAAGLHRQGRAREAQGLGRRPQAGRHRAHRRPAPRGALRVSGTSCRTARRSAASPTPCGPRASRRTSATRGCRSGSPSPARPSRSRPSTARPMEGTIASIPFVDPRKQAPAAALA